MVIGIDASRITRKNRTGTENYAYQLIEEIAKRDDKHLYRLYYNEKPVENIPSKNSLEEVVIPSWRMWTQYRLARELFTNPVDLLFVPAHTIPVFRPKRMKTIVTIHDLGAQYLKEYHQFPHSLYLNRSTEYVLKHASHIIVVSEATKKEAIERFHVSESRMTVIYEGYNNQIFDFSTVNSQRSTVNRIMEKYQIKKPYFLFVGTIQPRKNLLRIINSYAKIKEEVDLVIVGGKGWLYEEILLAPHKLGIAHRVHFLDYVSDEDLPFLYNNAEAFVFPSLCEGFGIPLLEAMASGCPVVTSNLSSMPEIVGEAGLLVDPYDENSITKSLEQALNTDWQNKVREKGLKRVKNFSWEKAAKETISVFEKVLKS